MVPSITTNFSNMLSEEDEKVEDRRESSISINSINKQPLKNHAGELAKGAVQSLDPCLDGNQTLKLRRCSSLNVKKQNNSYSSLPHVPPCKVGFLTSAPLPVSTSSSVKSCNVFLKGFPSASPSRLKVKTIELPEKLQVVRKDFPQSRSCDKIFGNTANALRKTNTTDSVGKETNRLVSKLDEATKQTSETQNYDFCNNYASKLQNRFQSKRNIHHSNSIQNSHDKNFRF
ncbi:hypothetical protein Anas_07873 [Armadillidium nasatum]|uniref:Uncharacterized protein n=1 Tax=Armadillidium nasatum TaxID=96803 RepID=A0A5N5TNQ6_9CRUS|nr:hypothetical protein Anas_07873 [Armadillidium nasatum]